MNASGGASELDTGVCDTVDDEVFGIDWADVFIASGESNMPPTSLNGRSRRPLAWFADRPEVITDT